MFIMLQIKICTDLQDNQEKLTMAWRDMPDMHDRL